VKFLYNLQRKIVTFTMPLKGRYRKRKRISKENLDLNNTNDSDNEVTFKVKRPRKDSIGVDDSSNSSADSGFKSNSSSSTNQINPINLQIPPVKPHLPMIPPYITRKRVRRSNHLQKKQQFHLKKFQLNLSSR